MLTSEWDTLPLAFRIVLRVVILEARVRGRKVSHRFLGPEFYAYRLCGRKIAWGINSSMDGVNLVRGVR